MTLLDYTDTPFARRPRLHRKPSLEGHSSAGFARRNLVGVMGVMMSGASSPKAKYTGVQLVGSSVKLENNILSNFSSGNYGRLPFHVDITTSSSWEVSINAEFTSGTGGVCGLGSSNGWTPIYYYSGTITSYMYGVGWPVGGLAYSKGSNGYHQHTIRFDGGKYEVLRDGEIITSLVSSARCNNNNVTYTIIGGNRGTGSLTANIDLSKCHIKIGDELTWEGVAGAYAMANSPQT